MLTGPLRVVEYDLVAYRRTWRGSLLTSFISPLLFLAAMGVGLGSLVHNGSGTVNGVSYLSFLAPGLMAATAMQTAAVETMYPIKAKVFWNHIYDAILATPLTVRDVLFGEASWLTLRLTSVAAAFFAVMAVFGIVNAPLAALAIPAATLCGLAFGLPILAFSAAQMRDTGFAAMNRFLVLPSFLLSGPFFPIEQLPRALQAVAWALPLAHGVALTRGLVLGTLGGGAAVLHVAVLVAYVLLGLALGRWILTRRLVT